MEKQTQFVDAEDDFHYSKEKVSFRTILLNHLGKITQISLEPLNQITKQKYINAIYMLADISLPYFDSTMKGVETKFNNKIKKVKEDWLTEADNKATNYKSIQEQYLITETFEACRKYFRGLTSFLKRQNYFSVGDTVDR